jgi:5-methyltetrahydropteroyltriglutamate--homocysteine methyltransferase
MAVTATMKHSTERILVTHTGSLPRPPGLVQAAEGRDQAALRAIPGFETQVRAAVFDVVRRQADTGIDVANDGEMSKTGFQTYITERIAGFEGPPRTQSEWLEARLFPEYYAAAGNALPVCPSCNGPVTWRGPDCVQTDIALLKAAVHDVAIAEAFMPAIAPGQVWYTFPNEHYDSDEKYLFAIADALKHEYRAIVDAGFVLQLDSPQLAQSWNTPDFADKSYADYRKFLGLHIAAINRALDGLPADRVRLHVCWGNNERPHVRDVPLAEIIDVVYQAKVGAISFEGANPRHAHEWKVFQTHPLPDGRMIIPGVIDTLTNFVEHPELVAERIGRYANIVGRENVIAGTDCGFSSRVRANLRVHPTVAWAKLRSLAEGARLATAELWA